MELSSLFASRPLSHVVKKRLATPSDRALTKVFKIKFHFKIKYPNLGFSSTYFRAILWKTKEEKKVDHIYPKVGTDRWVQPHYVSFNGPLTDPVYKKLRKFWNHELAEKDFNYFNVAQSCSMHLTTSIVVFKMNNTTLLFFGFSIGFLLLLPWSNSSNNITRKNGQFNIKIMVKSLCSRTFLNSTCVTFWFGY